MRSHNASNIYGGNLHIEWSNEKNIVSQKLKYLFPKNYTTIVRTYWATKYKSRSKNEFWAT